MKQTLVCFFSACAIMGTAAAQSGYSDAGGRSDGMGNTSVTIQDVFSASNNQAAMAFLKGIQAGISTQNYFMVAGGINAYDAAVTLSTKQSGTFGLSMNYSGDNTFNQTEIGLGYARKLAEQVAVGIQLDYVGTKTIEVGSGTAFTFDMGVLYKPMKTFTIGAHVFNPLRVKTGFTYEQELPAIINVGFAYQPSEKILICAEGEQNINDDLRAKCGLEYHIADALFLRGGYISNPSMFTCGIGIQIKDLKIDIASQFHQQLGAAPGIGLNYSF